MQLLAELFNGAERRGGEVADVVTSDVGSHIFRAGLRPVVADRAAGLELPATLAFVQCIDDVAEVGMRKCPCRVRRGAVRRCGHLVLLRGRLLVCVLVVAVGVAVVPWRGAREWGRSYLPVRVVGRRVEEGADLGEPSVWVLGVGTFSG